MPSQRQNIMVAEWAPDMPDLASATNIAINVIPVTPQSYGPFSVFNNWTTNVMDGQCVGGISIHQGSSPNFFGTIDKLYLLGGFSTHTLTDVSGATYAVPAGAHWSFAVYFQSVFATQVGDPIQSYNLGVSTNFGPIFTGTAWAQSTVYATIGEQIIANGNRYTLVSAGTSAATGTGPGGTGVGIVDGTASWNYQGGPPPRATYMCVPKNFLMVANTDDPVGGRNGQRLWWSISGDPTTWPAPGSEAAIQGMSDYNDFEGNIGSIVGIIDSLAAADVAIFFQHAIWRGNFVGPPDAFDFYPIHNVRGCPAPFSIVAYGDLVYFLSEDGFQVFDGATSTPIGSNKFDQWFWNTVAPTLIERGVCGAAYPQQKAILWAFPSKKATAGTLDTLLVYRWDIQRAAYVDLSASPVDFIMPSTNYFRPSIVLTVGAVNSLHSFGFFDGGANMAAQVATQTVQLTPGRRSYFQSARPLVDLTSGTPTIAVSGRVDLYDTETFGPDVAPDVSGECPQRNDARYHDVLIKIPASAVWTHIEGADATFTGSGYR